MKEKCKNCRYEHAYDEPCSYCTDECDMFEQKPLILGKFKNEEELRKAYQELEKAYTKKCQESKEKEATPVPYSLSQWNSGTEILYMCPTCGCDLRMLGNIQNYCYKCGQKFDWRELPKYCSEEFKAEYRSIENKYANNEIAYEEMTAQQKEMFFKIYEKACMKKR